MTSSKSVIPHKKPFDGMVRPLQEKDLPFLRPILETWIRNMHTHEILLGELEETFKAMKESISGTNEKTYFVAETLEGQVIGVTGISTPDERLHQYITTNNPIELINAFVHPNHRRKGVGRALVTFIENYVKNKGHTELILTSGPRYQFSGWGAWNKFFGKPIATAQNYFDEKYPAQVWGKLL